MGNACQAVSQSATVAREAGGKPALPRNCKRNEICNNHWGGWPWEGAESRSKPPARRPAWRYTEAAFRGKGVSRPFVPAAYCRLFPLWLCVHHSAAEMLRYPEWPVV